MLEMPTLFIAAEYVFTCECVNSRLDQPMRDHCPNLTTRVVQSGHWMAQEKPVEVNAAIAHWLATSLTDFWPNCHWMRQKEPPDRLERLRGHYVRIVIAVS